MTDSERQSAAIERAVEKLGYCQEADREHIPDDVSENQFGDGYHCFWCQEEVELDLVTDGGTDGHGQAIVQPPMLKFAEEHIDPILKGQKTVTLRLNLDYEAFQIGRRIHLCDEDGEWFASAIVSDRGYTTANMVAKMDFDGHRNYRDADELLEELAEYYPAEDIDYQTTLEIVYWGELWQ